MLKFTSIIPVSTFGWSWGSMRTSRNPLRPYLSCKVSLEASRPFTE